MTKPELSIFAGSQSVGEVYEEQNEIIVPFFEAAIPLSSTSSRIQLNLAGKSRILVLQAAVSGIGFSGATPNDKIGQFVYLMEQWVNSGIQTTRTYTSSLEDEYTVNAFNFKWRRSKGDPNRIIYTLLMKES